MRKFLISLEILIYLSLSAGFAFGLIPAANYSDETISQIAAAVILIVFCALFLLSASASKNYFLFRTPLISFLILTLCFSVGSFDNMLISNDLFCIVIFSLALVFFASKGENRLFLPSLAAFSIAIFAFIFHNKDITPTNVFFVLFSSVSAIFSFVSSLFNNKMKVFKREAELKERIAHKIQTIAKRGRYDITRTT